MGVSEIFRHDWRELNLPELPGLVELTYEHLGRASREPVGDLFYHGISISPDGVNIQNYNVGNGVVDILEILLKMDAITPAVFFPSYYRDYSRWTVNVPMFTVTQKGMSYLSDRSF